MADDDINRAGDDRAYDDDFYSLGNSTDDYWRFRDNYKKNYYDDDDYYSTKKATSWLDSLLGNTTASKEGKLTPVQDINPDNVLATLVFNSFVCLILLGLYEVLRRWIPSVYSQRLVNENESYYSSGGEGCNGGGDVVETCVEDQFMGRSQMMTSGQSLRGMRVSRSVMRIKSSEEDGDREAVTNEEQGVLEGENEDAREDKKIEAADENKGAEKAKNKEEVEGENREAGGDDHDDSSDECNGLQKEARTSLPNIIQEEKYPWLCAFHVLEWCIPVHKTPWSTLRRIAGLDAYFYLRYIRMCLKITTVSSFWAIVILCPVYATGGGDQIGFYHFSMANVLQEDKGRVWVPVFFCWAFTMYCCFCVRAEMMHYVELRMEFLGGEEEQRILQRKGILGRGMGGRIRLSVRQLGGYGSPKVNSSNASNENGDETESVKPRCRSTMLTTNMVGAADTSTTHGCAATVIQNKMSSIETQVQQKMKQHRYSLEVEKVPVELRSNTALYNYFNEMFPNQVHSASIAMNVPDLDALSARRMRVCRRLEKSLAYLSTTGIRPTHIAGRPRCWCCGIESSPIDASCLASCCFGDLWRMKTQGDGDEGRPMEIYETLPEKGERVDSILYYTLDLANCNMRMKKMQQEKFHIAETGKSFRRKGAGVGHDEWYARPLGMLKRGAAMTAEGLRDEFEVSGEEDYLGDGFTGVDYGSVRNSCTDLKDKQSAATIYRSTEKGNQQSDLSGCLSREDAVGAISASSFIEVHSCEEDFGGAAARRRKTRYHRPHTHLRAFLWRMGVDFLAAGLDEVRNQTDVVVDSVTRPSMSSTGFVTFKTLTPVTVTTSAPLTYNQNPMEVSIAPEPRDLVWQNVQIDRDIRSSRSFFANVLLGLGVLLWSIPLTLIQAWAKVEKVALIPGLEWVDQIPGGTWKTFVNGYLPVIALLSLILILPLIFQWVATSYEKRQTLSGVQNSIVGRYFYYQLANIYITVTAGALWTSLAEIIDHPQKLLVILGETLPKLAGYFISLLITKTLAGLPMVLLRTGALSRMVFLRSCFNKKRLTQRELLKEVYRKQPIYYGWEYPTQFLVIIICFTYACITPFVLPVGAVYFFCALLIYKKQALYVYTPTYESGGRMFPQAVSKTLFALLISQMTFIGYTLIRKGALQIILLAPMPFLTVFFTLFIQHRFVEPSKKLSLERAVKIDALLDQSPEFSHEAYQQPVLTEKAYVPICGTNENIVKEVIENLDHLQNQTTPISFTSPASFDNGCFPHEPRLRSCAHAGDHEIFCPIEVL